MLIRSMTAAATLAWLAALPLAQAHAQMQTPAPTQVPARADVPAPVQGDAATPPQAQPASGATTAKGKLAPRRPTRQVNVTPLPTVTNGYRPTLYPPATPSGMADPVGMLPVHPTPLGAGAAPPAPLPVQVGACTSGGCLGTNGVHYNPGAAGVTVDPAGRTCHQVGTTMQCF